MNSTYDSLDHRSEKPAPGQSPTWEDHYYPADARVLGWEDHRKPKSANPFTKPRLRKAWDEGHADYSAAPR